MANSNSENPNSNNDGEDKCPPNVSGTVDDEAEPYKVDEEEDDEENKEDEDDEDDEPPLPRKLLSEEARLRAEKSNLENLVNRMSDRVNLRVHDVLIKGNTKTKEHLIEAELEAIKKATSAQELLEAAGIANAKLQ